MRRNASDDRLFGRTDPDAGPAFLSTPRAHSACEREFDRICSTLVDHAERHLSADGRRAPEIRRAPARCVVQGPGAALTVAWICNASARVDTGELMAILWTGFVASRGDPIPERRLQRPIAPPVAVWETSLRPVAGTAATWAWQAADADAMTSADLAAQLAERLAGHVRLLPTLTLT